MKLRVELVREAKSLEALRPEWAALLSRSEMNQPTLDPRWLLCWWRVFGGEGGRSLRVLAMRDGGRLVGLAPLVSRVGWYRPGLPFRRLELLGSGEPQADEICSEYIGVIAERGAEPSVAKALVRALREGSLRGWDELLMPAMAGDGPMPSLLVQELSRVGIDARLENAAPAPYISLPTSFRAYLDALPSSHRYLVTRSLRELEAWAGGKVTLERANTHSELAYGRRLLESLHDERWRAKSSPGGAFGSPRFRAFHDEVMPALLDAGALDLLWISVHGEPLAALYNIVWNGKVHFYQSGRRLDVPKPIRPGIAIHALAIARAIEQGLSEYDFLAGASQYKTQLALGSRPLVRLRAVRSRLREQARSLLEGAHKQLADWRNEARARVQEWRKSG